MKIRVTQECIDAGTPRACGSCPVALAVIDAFLEKVRVEVFGFGISVVNQTKLKNFFLPEVAFKFMEKFDRGESVEPFEFEAIAA